MFRRIRIALLLFVLASVGQTAWLARARTAAWDGALGVVVYPINGDGSSRAAAHIGQLTRASFGDIETFFKAEAARYGLRANTPLEVRLGPEVAVLPPPAPVERRGLGVIAWSLRMRFWAWRNDRFEGPKPDIRIFVLFHDPARSPRLEHSLGLQKGLLGVVHAFAADHMATTNNVIIAHELMHTLGATDKYDPSTGRPVHPDGYAEPDRSPLHPQRLAEIMGGRIPLAPGRAETPEALSDTVVGPATAAEIRWVR